MSEKLKVGVSEVLAGGFLGDIRLRNDDRITYTILLVLFHFFGVVKVFKYYCIRRFYALKKRKITSQYGVRYFINVPKI